MDLLDKLPLTSYNRVQVPSGWRLTSSNLGRLDWRVVMVCGLWETPHIKIKTQSNQVNLEKQKFQ